jgi:hypothetical protein
LGGPPSEAPGGRAGRPRPESPQRPPPGSPHSPLLGAPRSPSTIVRALTGSPRAPPNSATRAATCRMPATASRAPPDSRRLPAQPPGASAGVPPKSATTRATPAEVFHVEQPPHEQDRSSAVDPRRLSSGPTSSVSSHPSAGPEASLFDVGPLDPNRPAGRSSRVRGCSTWNNQLRTAASRTTSLFHVEHSGSQPPTSARHRSAPRPRRPPPRPPRGAR